jgi:type II secretory pathway component GspD/PulD (secretin)
MKINCFVVLGLAVLGVLAGSNARCAEQTFAPGGINFTGADILQVLDLYQELSGRTIFRQMSIPAQKFTMRNETELTQGEAVALIENTLAKAGVKMVPEGKKFVYVIRADSKPSLPKFDAKAMAEKIEKPDEVFSAGLVRMVGASNEQILGLYSALVGRKAVPPAANVPVRNFDLRTQTELTRAEAVFALEAIAGVNGLEFKMVGQDGVTLGPAGRK